jgi:hypothetical protein
MNRLAGDAQFGRLDRHDFGDVIDAIDGQAARLGLAQRQLLAHMFEDQRPAGRGVYHEGKRALAVDIDVRDQAAMKVDAIRLLGGQCCMGGRRQRQQGDQSANPTHAARSRWGSKRPPVRRRNSFQTRCGPG